MPRWLSKNDKLEQKDRQLRSYKASMDAHIRAMNTLVEQLNDRGINCKKCMVQTPMGNEIQYVMLDEIVEPLIAGGSEADPYMTGTHIVKRKLPNGKVECTYCGRQMSIEDGCCSHCGAENENQQIKPHDQVTWGVLDNMTVNNMKKLYEDLVRSTPRE